MTRERVAEAVRGTDKTWRARAIASRLADFRNQIRQIRLGDEGVRPQPLLEFGFREDARAHIDQRGEELERLRRQVHAASITQQLPRIAVERERTEGRRHKPPRKNLPISREFPGTGASAVPILAPNLGQGRSHSHDHSIDSHRRVRTDDDRCGNRAARLSRCETGGGFAVRPCRPLQWGTVRRRGAGPADVSRPPADGTRRQWAVVRRLSHADEPFPALAGRRRVPIPAAAASPCLRAARGRPALPAHRCR